MKNLLILGWKFWKNKRFLTLECSDERVSIYPELTYSVEHPRSPNFRVIGRREKNREIIAVNFMRLIDREHRCIIKRIVFCRQGIDIELFKEYEDTDYYEIMSYIAGNIKELFPNYRVEFKENI